METGQYPLHVNYQPNISFLIHGTAQKKPATPHQLPVGKETFHKETTVAGKRTHGQFTKAREWNSDQLKES